MKSDYSYSIVTKEADSITKKELLQQAALIHSRKPDTLDWLNWKYFGSPFGESICMIAQTEDKELAGEVTFGKYEYCLNGRIIKCLISYQTMVHPNHQRKNIFQNLCKKIFDIAAVEKIDLVVNFPNKASYKPFEKLHFTPINHIQNYVYFTIKYSTLIHLLFVKKAFTGNQIHCIPPEQLARFEKLGHTIKPLDIPDVFVPNRTKEYIKWRFFTFPLYDYRIIDNNYGWAIVRKGKRGKLTEVQIMEMFPFETFSRKFIVEIKKSIIKELHPHLILLNASTTHPATPFLNKLLFFKLPNQINFFTYALNEKMKTLLNKEKWVVTATEFHRY